MDLLYARGGRGSTRTMLGFFYTMYKLDCIWEEFINEKYYKGTQSILYLPYVRPKFNKVPLIKRKPKLYGYTIAESYFDEFMEGLIHER